MLVVVKKWMVILTIAALVGLPISTAARADTHGGEDEVTEPNGAEPKRGGTRGKPRLGGTQAGGPKKNGPKTKPSSTRGSAPKSRTEDSEPAANQELIDHLRALPYAGFTPGRADQSVRGVVLHLEKECAAGYNLVVFPSLCRAELFNARGEIVRTWEEKSNHRWSNCELLPNGDLIVIGHASPSREDKLQTWFNRNGYLMRLNWEGEELWRQQIAAHHDVELIDGKRIAVLTHHVRKIDEFSTRAPVLDNRITLLSLDGEILDQRSIRDMLVADEDVYKPNRVHVQSNHGHKYIDLLHTNSLEWMRWPKLASKSPIFGPDNVLLSIRHQDTVAIVDWKSEKVVWAWGSGRLSGPHCATMLENGHVMVFDNGLGRNWSRVIEIDPLTDKIVWTYRAPNREEFHSETRGSCQRFANGNTLIANSDNGQAFEVTPDGKMVWTYLSPYFNEKGQRAVIERIKRYPKDMIENIGM